MLHESQISNEKQFQLAWWVGAVLGAFANVDFFASTYHHPLPGYEARAYNFH